MTPVELRRARARALDALTQAERHLREASEEEALHHVLNAKLLLQPSVPVTRLNKTSASPVSLPRSSVAKRVYLVTDPRDRARCYVGATKASLNGRMAGLRFIARSGFTSPVADMIRDVRAAGLEPDIGLLYESTYDWPTVEQMWIDDLSALCGASVLNVRRGGMGPDPLMSQVAQ